MIRWEPELLARVVADALDRAPRAAEQYRRAAEPLYALDAAQRASAFYRLDGEFAADLGIARVIEQAITRARFPGREISGLRLAPAARSRDEMADLIGSRVEIRLRPTRFQNLDGLARLLDHELRHIADLLDPEFGYDGAREVGIESGPEALVRDRYRALWCASIEARLNRTAAARLPELATLFGVERREFERVDNFLRSCRPTHAQLRACAEQPQELAALIPGLRAPAVTAARTRCPLCRMPAFPSARQATDLPPWAVVAVRAQLESWSPEDGLCDRCRELVLSDGGSPCP